VKEYGDFSEVFSEAAKRLNVHAGDLTWWSWPEVFGSTAGPHSGVGGQAMTPFQVIRFENQKGEALMWCVGKWKIPKSAEHSWHR